MLNGHLKWCHIHPPVCRTQPTMGLRCKNKMITMNILLTIYTVDPTMFPSNIQPHQTPNTAVMSVTLCHMLFSQQIIYHTHINCIINAMLWLCVHDILSDIARLKRAQYKTVRTYIVSLRGRIKAKRVLYIS